jgi:hypothetical protein
MFVKLHVDQWILFLSLFLRLMSFIYPLQAQRIGYFFSLSKSVTLTHFLGRAPLDEGPPNAETYTTLKTDIHVTGRIRTHDPSKRTASDLRLRPPGF